MAGFAAMTASNGSSMLLKGANTRGDLFGRFCNRFASSGYPAYQVRTYSTSYGRVPLDRDPVTPLADA